MSMDGGKAVTNTSKFWIAALIVGAVGVGVIVANRPRVEVAPAVPAAVAEPAPETAKAALRLPATKKNEARPIVMTAGLMALAKPLLQRGTDLTMASAGFVSSESFIATAHAAKNLGIPFVVLKDRVVAQRMSLAAAIHDVKPAADAKAEASRATSAAHDEISRPS